MHAVAVRVNHRDQSPADLDDFADRHHGDPGHRSAALADADQPLDREARTVAEAPRHRVVVRVNRRDQSPADLDDFADRHHGDRVLQREARPVRDRLAPMTPHPTCRHCPQRQ